MCQNIAKGTVGASDRQLSKLITGRSNWIIKLKMSSVSPPALLEKQMSNEKMSGAQFWNISLL